jgi:hypothetical protein
MLTVAILGNHDVPYCTECELDWTFEHLGHKVIRFQENRSQTHQILSQCLAERVDLLVYVHTHGWNTPGAYTMDQLIQLLRVNGIKTCSFHLDLYWGLNVIDKRQDRIGTHPFWHTDYVFTADGGHQDKFEQRGVNHFWLPPAVVERGCYRGDWKPNYATDIAFVGSKIYHPEYPFRGQLLDYLGRNYGDRFRRYNGDTQWGIFREQKLNDMYASVKINVGDSCYSGIRNYWSDRVPETLGRGGFLIHPEVEGLNIPGLVTYEPRNLVDLKSKIEYYLNHGEERNACMEQSFADVKANHTYTNRVRDMLSVMGLA